MSVNRLDFLHVAALAVLRQIADCGLSCWDRDILLELDKLSLTDYWVHQPLKVSQFLRNLSLKLPLYWRESITKFLRECRFYCNIMDIPRLFGSFFDYIICIKKDDHRISLKRLRVLSSWLAIITGAWSHVRGKQRLSPVSKWYRI